MTPKGRRRPPTLRVIVHASRERADLMILILDRLAAARKAGLDRSELTPLDPLEHVDLPRTIQARGGHNLEVAAVPGRNDPGHLNAGRLEGAQPRKFRL